MFEARSWSDTPPCEADGGQEKAAVFTVSGTGRLPVTGGTDSWLAHWLPGEPAEGTPLTTPLIRAIVRWDLAQAHRKVRHVSRV